MSRDQLELAIDTHLKAVDLDSRSPQKYAPIAQAFADHFAVAPSKVGVKSLADTKNFGNRISEATGHDIDLLVLLAMGHVERSAIRRALETRALRSVPAFLVRNASGGWRLDCQFMPHSRAPLIAGLTVMTVPASTRATATNVADLDADVSKLEGVMSESEFLSRIQTLEDSFPGLAAKHVGDAKNVKNRVREALGRRPAALLLVVPKGVVEAAEATLKAEAGAATKRYVAWYASGMGRYRDVQIMASMVAEPTQQYGDASQRYLRMPDSRLEELEYRQLERVKQMKRFLPLGADASSLFEEHLVGDQRIQYETKALGYLRKLVARQRRCFIVLTGNAGHGKTHMCRRLLEQADDLDLIMPRLQDDKEGSLLWSVPDASLPIRVVKDLSELEPPARAADILQKLMGQEAAHVVVCANEGRLRDVVSRSPDALGSILKALERGLVNGDTNPEKDDSVHVINLNFQAAVANEGGFLREVLASFLDNQAAWNVCSKCRAQEDCPIRSNRSALTLSRSSEADNRHARESLMDLVRIAEESGYVLTYRETLILVAFLITGGLNCRDVERLHRDRRHRAELRSYDLLRLLFEPSLTEDEMDVLRVLQTINRLDPGRVALRPIDEELHQQMEREGHFGAGVFGEDSIQPKARRDLDREITSYQELVRDARRRAWLRCSDADEERLGVSRSQRIGLEHHHLFRLLQKRPGATELVSILRRLVKGLHTIQGAVNVDSKTSLHLVDPAFGRSGNHSAVIARSIRIKDLELWSESGWWSEQRDDHAPPILESVDWIDRRVLLIDRNAGEVLLSLDLAALEFVMSAADGIVMQEFHSADRRRILTRLAHHAERGRRDSDEIRVLLERGDGALTVERDGTILLETS